MLKSPAIEEVDVSLRIAITVLCYFALPMAGATLKVKTIDIGNAGKGLADVAVTVEQAGRQRTEHTDVNGNYSFNGLMAGQVTVKYEKVAYQVAPSSPNSVQVHEPSLPIVAEMFKEDKTDSAYAVRVFTYNQLRQEIAPSDMTEATAISIASFATKLQRSITTDSKPPTLADLKPTREFSTNGLADKLVKGASEGFDISDQKREKLVLQVDRK